MTPRLQLCHVHVMLKTGQLSKLMACFSIY